MNIFNIDHININAPKSVIADMLEFYTGVLGFQVGDRPKTDEVGYWLYSNRRPLIHLDVDESRALKTGDVIDHVSFSIFHLDYAMRKLEENGIEFKRVDIAGMTLLFFLDPIGNKIELLYRG